VLIPLLYLLLSIFSQAQTAHDVKVGYILTPPLVYTTHDNKLTGIAFDLLQSFLKEADIFQISYLPFTDKKSATEALATGNIDIFLGNLDDTPHANIVTTSPYMIDGVYALPLPQSFTARLTQALNWQDLAVNTSFFFLITSSLCAFILVIFDSHHHKNLRFQSLSVVFFSHLFTLFSSFSRNLVSAPLSTVGRVVTATWTAAMALSMVFLTSVITCALISALSLPTPKAITLAELSGQRVGLLEDGFGTAYALSNTASLRSFADTHDLIDALAHDKIDYAVVSGAFFTRTSAASTYGRETGLAHTPVTLNPQTIALNKHFASTMLFEESKVTYGDYFNDAINRALHSLSLYHLCTRYVTTPFASVF
jgi:ABC-type amino acid transport substrate-binding protein